jgi:hypothetical protein
VTAETQIGHFIAYGFVAVQGEFAPTYLCYFVANKVVYDVLGVRGV